jgi:uncharacterized protein YndB with AHSA1/START domain
MTSTSLVIHARPEQVWDLVADVTRMGEWSPETVAGEWLDGATGPEPGARFKGRNKRRGAWSTTCKVTEAERGKVFTFEVGKGETRWSYRFSPADGGCHVTESFEILRPPGPIGRWLTKLGTGVTWAEREDDLVAGMEETLKRLGTAAEATSA